MRAIFESKFPDLERIKKCAMLNEEMIKHGSGWYLKFIDVIKNIQEIDDNNYNSISDIYDKLKLKPFHSVSKRNLYSKYNSGVIVGAGSGNDCIDLLDNEKWFLFDLSDDRMDNRAIGYCQSTAIFNMTGTRDGDTLTSVDAKYKKAEMEIEIIRIDDIDFADTGVGIISMDVEGSALDVLAGATETINLYKPDLLVSIYHNWIEYLLCVPFIHDLGYEINIVVTANMLPYQPHLELSLICRAKI